MERLKLTAENLPQAAQKAADVLRRGFAIVYPTDTLYGLGVDALNQDAVERFFALKKRPDNQPVPIFVRDIEMAKECAFIDKKQEAILEKLWPGAFTLVVFKKNKISTRLTGGTQKVGLRIPDSALCRQILDEFGGPITASSANISGEEAPRDADGIIQQFKEHSMPPDLIIDAGDVGDTQPSTVIDITGAKPAILRMRATTPEQMRAILKVEEIFKEE